MLFNFAMELSGRGEELVQLKDVLGTRALRSSSIHALVVAFILTLAAVCFEETLFTRTTLIDSTQSSADSRYSYSDQLLGGRSTINMAADQALAGTCSLKKGYEYPFCGLGVTVDQRPGKGLNLSRVQRVVVDLTYEGSADLLRLSLKNFDPRYSQVGKPETDKPNKLDLSVRSGRQTISIALSDFVVADWWLTQIKASPAISGTQFNNIVAIEIQTGPDARSGVQIVRVHSIKFSERVLAPSQLYTLITVLWFLIIAWVIIQARRERELAQRQVAERGQQILDAIPQMVWCATESGYEYYNKQWASFTGADVGGGSGPRRLDLVHPDDRGRAAELWRRSLESGDPYECEYRLLHQSGDYRWVLSRGVQEISGDGRVAWFGTCTDIHERVIAAQERDESERLTRGLVSALPDRVSILDPDGATIFVNAARLAAGDGEELLGRNWIETLPSSARDEAALVLTQAQNGQIGRITYATENSMWWDTLLAPVSGSDGSILRILAVSRDVTDQKAAEEHANWTAQHDSLTRLPNRHVLHQKLEEMTFEGRFALALLDVDDFKRVNDVAGHDAGDALLCAFAERLQSAVRTGDTVARLSGDEFALLLPGIGTEAELKALLERLFAELRRPCVHAGRLFDCSASVGAGILGRHGATISELLKNADLALYAAKKAGKKNFKVFRSSMRKQMQKRATMLSRARTAITERQILPYYQPIVDLRSRSIVGFEALLRWRHSRCGIQLPARLAAAFEDQTLAAEMSEQVVNGVLADMVCWREQGLEVGHVAINASAAEFRSGRYAETLLEKLHRARVPSSAVQIEVTETVFLGRGAECVERALKTLSGEGIKIALDDFGTGYASLSHLKQFPIDILKIDQSFVREIVHAHDQAPIIQAVVNLGRSLDIGVVAEGVETAQQHQFLQNLGCHFGQGFLYSAAVSAKQITTLLKASESDQLAA